MARKKPKKTEPQPEWEPFVRFTANQVVAFNLAQAREWRDWTQEEAAEALEPFLGVRWSKATLSQAERSVAGRFIRNFTADEIVAFARGFELPVTWFFMPPPPWAEPGFPSRLEAPDEPRFAQPVAVLVDLVFGDDAQQGLLTLRLEAFLDALGPAGLTAAQGRIAALVAHRMEALAANTFRELEQWQTTLRAMANQLGQFERRSKRAVATDLGIKPSELHMPPRRSEDDEAGDDEAGDDG